MQSNPASRFPAPPIPDAAARRKAAVRSWLYDRVLTGLTSDWYREVLARLPAKARILDVGIGTGTAIARSAAEIRAKRIEVTGLDIDRDYVQQCRKTLAKVGLAAAVTPRLESVYDHQGGPYDAVYFSASFMLLPDPVGAIHHVAAQLSPQGRIFFTQTFHHERSVFRERMKPLLHRFTSVDFGRVTYEDEFRAALTQAGLEVTEMVTMDSNRRASYRLVVARPIRGERRISSA